MEWWKFEKVEMQSKMKKMVNQDKKYEMLQYG